MFSGERTSEYLRLFIYSLTDTQPSRQFQSPWTYRVPKDDGLGNRIPSTSRAELKSQAARSPTIRLPQLHTSSNAGRRQPSSKSVTTLDNPDRGRASVQPPSAYPAERRRSAQAEIDKYHLSSSMSRRFKWITVGVIRSSKMNCFSQQNTTLYDHRTDSVSSLNRCHR